MAYPDVNNVNNLNCSLLAFLYDSTSSVNAIYLNCGDYTPITVKSTQVGAPSAVYKVVSGVAASVVLTTGILSAGKQVGGYGQQYVPWVQAVTTVPASAIQGSVTVNLG